MGWASYFEDICARQDDAVHSTTAVICGPAGTPPRTLPTALAASYSRLRVYYGKVGPDIIDNYEKGQWLRLSQEMDAVDQDVAHFNTITLMAGIQKMLINAGSLSQRLQSLLARARRIMAYLNSQLMNVFSELENVQRHKKFTYNLSVPESEEELEKHVFWLYHGWKALRMQIEDLESRYDELQIKLAGKVQKRLMDDPHLRFPIKDDL